MSPWYVRVLVPSLIELHEEDTPRIRCSRLPIGSFAQSARPDLSVAIRMRSVFARAPHKHARVGSSGLGRSRLVSLVNARKCEMNTLRRSDSVASRFALRPLLELIGVCRRESGLHKQDGGFLASSVALPL